ncbi:hypothetical protein D910_10042 [Dendroctonus ponderosae]
MLQLKYYPDEGGYNFRYYPDIRYYYDDKIQRVNSALYDYPYRTRIWFPYRGYRVFCDYMPSGVPFAIQRVSKLMYFNYYDTKKHLHIN